MPARDRVLPKLLRRLGRLEPTVEVAVTEIQGLKDEIARLGEEIAILQKEVLKLRAPEIKAKAAKKAPTL